MKRRPIIPQAEFGFAGDSFALVAEKAQPVSAPTIMAEMTDAERENVRQQSKETTPTDPIFGAVAKEAARHQLGAKVCACGCGDAIAAEVETTPGLAPGSYWSTPMRKALATMQK
jgi:hypothetical protein